MAYMRQWRISRQIEFEQVPLANALPCTLSASRSRLTINSPLTPGAGTIEVVVRLQKAFESLAAIENTAMRDVATQNARRALERAENTLKFPNDLEDARKCAEFAMPDAS